jgi:hypothetical protein
MSSVIEQRIATLLGNLGLVPFFVLALLTWAWPGAAGLRIEFALAAYAACILSFLGAVHWGLALANPQLDKAASWNVLGWGVLPSLLGWLAVLMLVLRVPSPLVFVFLIGDLILVRVVDGLLFRHYAPPVPAWYPALRTRLTLGACVCLALAAAGSAAR